MRALTFIIVAFVGIFTLQAKTITDMAGRKVEIPDKVERILPYDPKTSIFIFPVLEDKMVAASVLPGKKDYQFIAEPYKNMPEMDVKNIEAVLATAPQVILYGIYEKNDNTEPVLDLGRRLNIPVIMVNLSLDKLDDAYRFLGSVFSVDKKCIPLIAFIQKVYITADSLKKVNPAVSANVYYSIGPNGLMTDPAGSKHTEVLDYMKIPNVAKVDIPTGGHAKVNMEQVILWNPDYILTSNFKSNTCAYNTIVSDSKWSTIKAVQEKNIYKVPSQPMGWLDHPPSINRLPGMIWSSGIFYQYPEEKVKNDILKFYKLFYKYSLTDSEYKLLFNPE
ncbi:ABC transporter substrate-binding protein [Draconibacterium sediminis]|uniref:ABC transporter substrate-binding protein n=1 Tax=Draconibacterium sediminis TaxID=1544798 RepID=UPI0026F21288|nr:ABC transporter substrate-binding protein [Draconibacterium sediminis]